MDENTLEAVARFYDAAKALDYAVEQMKHAAEAYTATRQEVDARGNDYDAALSAFLAADRG